MKGKILLNIIVVLIFSTFVNTAWAKDSDRARELLTKGEILSLSDILARVSSQVPGKILEIKLEEKKGEVVYEIEFLAEDGVVMEMYLDAKTAKILSIEVE